MSFEQVLLYLIASAAAIWGLLKVLIPRLVEARLESERDLREHRQESENVAVEILREMIKERSTEITELTHAINSLNHSVEVLSRRVGNYNELVTTLSREISHLRDEFRKD